MTLNLKFSKNMFSCQIALTFQYICCYFCCFHSSGNDRENQKFFPEKVTGPCFVETENEIHDYDNKLKKCLKKYDNELKTLSEEMTSAVKTLVDVVGKSKTFHQKLQLEKSTNRNDHNSNYYDERKRMIDQSLKYFGMMVRIFDGVERMHNKWEKTSGEIRYRSINELQSQEAPRDARRVTAPMTDEDRNYIKQLPDIL